MCSHKLKGLILESTIYYRGVTFENKRFSTSNAGSMVVKLFDSLVHGCYSGSYFVCYIWKTNMLVKQLIYVLLLQHLVVQLSFVCGIRLHMLLFESLWMLQRYSSVT